MPFAPVPFLLAAVLAAAPQGDGARGDAIVVLLRDPSAHAVRDAEVLFWPGPRPDLPVLEGLLPLPAPRLAHSDAGGMVRIPAEPGESGAMLVATAAGLGAVVPRAVAGEAQRIALAPMAEVTAAAGGELVLWAALVGADGARTRLGPLRGPAVRLPPGVYEVWAKHGETFAWRQLALRSGERTALRFDGPLRRVARAERAVVHPSGWPDVVLLGPDAEGCTLAGAAASAPLSALLPDGTAVADRALPGPPGSEDGEPLRWPPPAAGGARVRIAVEAEGDARARATLWSLRRTDRETWRLLGRAVAGDDGTFALERPSGGDDWVLAIAPDTAPAALPWPDVAVGRPLALRPGAVLRVDCTTPDDVPAAGVRLELVPATGELARSRARTDPRGRAWFAGASSPAALYVVDERWANTSMDVVAAGGAPVRVVLREGAVLRGRAVLHGGGPAANAAITVRDPTGTLRPAERTVLAGADGSFRFAGLGEGPLVLFATQQRGGRTWSSKRAGVIAGAADGAADGGTVEIVLRSEDPELPRGR